MNPTSPLPNPQSIDFALSLATPAGYALVAVALGALILMARALYRRSSRRSDLLPPLVCALLLIGSFFYSRALFLGPSGSLADFTEKTRDTLLDELEQEISQRSKVISAMAAHWGFVGRPPESVWKRDCEIVVRNLEGVISLVWADASAQVRWACPAELEARVKGFDIRADAERYARFLQVKESRRALFTPTRQLRIGVTGFALNTPVFVAGKFDGMIGGVFAGPEFFRSVFRAPDYIVRVYEDDRLIYDSAPEYAIDAKGPHQEWLKPGDFRHESLHWNVLVAPSPATIARERSQWPEIALWIGTILAVLLAFIVRLYLKAFETNNRLWVALEWEKAVFAGTHLGVFTADEKGTLRSVNAAAARILGYGKEDVLRRVSVDTWHVEDELRNRADLLSQELGSSVRAGADALLAKARVGGVDRNEWSIVAKDGTRRQVVLSMHALRDAGGGLDGFVGVLEDVTDVKAQVQEITLQRAKIAESSKLAALGEMAGGVAHEINNPLSVISGKAQILRMLLDQPAPEKDAMIKQVDAIRATVKRITRVISGMQNLARDATKDSFTRARIGEIIDDTVAFCAERFRNHSVDFRLDIEKPEFEIACRPTQVAQVLLNLLNNAFDAVAEVGDGRPRWVELRTRARGDWIECSVADSGPGIPAELRERIMLPFFTTKSVGKGTGLGLSIAHSIVAEHGGRLTLDEDSTTTRFIVLLPAATARALHSDAAAHS
jgi:PAS domain S-box-containing protein